MKISASHPKNRCLHSGDSIINTIKMTQDDNCAGSKQAPAHFDIIRNVYVACWPVKDKTRNLNSRNPVLFIRRQKIKLEDILSAKAYRDTRHSIEMNRGCEKSKLKS